MCVLPGVLGHFLPPSRRLSPRDEIGADRCEPAHPGNFPRRRKSPGGSTLRPTMVVAAAGHAMAIVAIVVALAMVVVVTMVVVVVM